MVQAEARGSRAPFDAAPRVVGVAGGKGGVGATTLAVNLAVALASEGQRVMVVDADLHRPDAALLCGWHEGPTVADVLEARRSLHEAIRPGPLGIQVLPGGWSAPGGSIESSAPARFVRQLRGLGEHADTVLVDLGTGAGAPARRYWQAVDEVVLVTTSEAVSVMDAYAAVKMLVTASDAIRVRSLVNQARCELEAADVHSRLRQACRRFLGIEIDEAGTVRQDTAVAAAGRAMRPVLVLSPGCAAAHDIGAIARRWQAATPQVRRANASDLAAV